MSKEKMEVELKKEDRELLQSVKSAIETSKRPVEVSKETSKTEKQTSESHHWKADEVLKHMTSDCPTCKGEGEKLKETLGKAYVKELRERESEFECKDCHTPVSLEEEECPLCGGKDASKRQKD